VVPPPGLEEQAAEVTRRTLSGSEVRRIVAGVDPRAVPDVCLTPAERNTVKHAIAQFILTSPSEDIDQRLSHMPALERRLWQQVRREVRAGKWTVSGAPNFPLPSPAPRT
jgi:hypothetical protein